MWSLPACLLRAWRNTWSTHKIQPRKLIVQAIEQKALPHILPQPRPPQIEDPNSPNQMIDDKAKMVIWNEEVKMIAKQCVLHNNMVSGANMPCSKASALPQSWEGSREMKDEGKLT